MKQRDLLPLNAVRGSGDRKPPSVVQEESSPSSGSGDKVPQKLKLFAHLNLISLRMVTGIRNAFSDVLIS